MIDFWSLSIIKNVFQSAHGPCIVVIAERVPSNKLGSHCSATPTVSQRLACSCVFTVCMFALQCSCQVFIPGGALDGI